MKLIKQTTLILSILLLCTHTSNAQFLKKLQKKVQKGVEETILDKAEQKVNEKTSEAFDKIFDKQIKKMTDDVSGSIKSVDPSEIPDSYEFSWLYAMQLENNEGNFNIDYFLNPDATYFGSKPKMEKQKNTGDMIIVMDIGRNINTIFMNSEGTKMAMPMSLEVDKDLIENDTTVVKNVVFTEIGKKTILGYSCDGYKIVNEDSEVIIYAYKNAPVSFTSFFRYDKKNAPKGLNMKWFDELENSLIMEMTYNDKTGNQITTKMTCTALEKKDMTINKEDYQFMNLNFPTGE